MTFTDFDTFADDIQDKMSQVWDDIQDKLSDMARILNDAADKFDWTDVVFFVPKKIIDGLTSDDVEKAIDKFNNEIRPEIEDKIRDITEQMNVVVSSMAGNPPALKQLSFAYADCKSELVKRAPSIESEIQQLGKSWKGDAFDAYSMAAKEQVTAMVAIATGLETASTMTSSAGQKILELWIDLADIIIKGLTAVIRLLSDATTVNAILSLEVPVVVEAIADILDFAQDIAKTLEDYMANVGFADQLQWRQLNNGTAGLPQNLWPVIHPGQVDDVTTPGDWTPKAG